MGSAGKFPASLISAVLILCSRARLPSLYSDFQVQKLSNPDGFSANYNTWMNAFIKAAQAGLLPSEAGTSNAFSLSIGEALLQALEIPERGRPLALRAVVVGIDLHNKS